MTAEGRSLLRGLSLFPAHLDFMLLLQCLKQPTPPTSVIVRVCVCVSLCEMIVEVGVTAVPLTAHCPVFSNKKQRQQLIGFI